MEQNHDWYERYQSFRPESDGTRTKNKERRGVATSTLLICMMIAVLLGGLLGGLYTRHYVDESMQTLSAQLTESQKQLAAANATATKPSASLETTTQGLVGQTYSKSQIIELCAPAVVGIDVTYQTSGYGYGYFGSSQTTTGSGSGIILTSDGYIVTCKHVVDSADTINVILNDDTEYVATLIGTDSRYDLAVIKIDATGLTPTTLGDSDMLTVGEDVIAIGNPLGELRGTATGGMLSALEREVSVEGVKMTLIQTDAAISPGNSGGGLFNASGSLIGIVNAKASSEDAEGLGFAIPVNSVKTIINDLIDHGYVTGRAYLGVSTQNVTLQSGQNGWGSSSFFGSYFGMGGTSCVMIAEVVSGSAADQAGLQAGDLILKLEDTEITSNSVLSERIAAYNAGDTVTLTIQRNGAEQTVSVTFGEYKPAS